MIHLLKSNNTDLFLYMFVAHSSNAPFIFPVAVSLSFPSPRAGTYSPSDSRLRQTWNHLSYSPVINTSYSLHIRRVFVAHRIFVYFRQQLAFTAVLIPFPELRSLPSQPTFETRTQFTPLPEPRFLLHITVLFKVILVRWEYQNNLQYLSLSSFHEQDITMSSTVLLHFT